MYKVTGIGLGDATLVSEKPTMAEAGYLASRMTDNGVRNTHIVDEAGNEVALDVALAAWLQEQGRRP